MSPVYVIDAKEKHFHKFGFKNVYPVEMIPRTKLDGFCEYTALENLDHTPSERLFRLEAEIKAARAVGLFFFSMMTAGDGSIYFCDVAIRMLHYHFILRAIGKRRRNQRNMPHLESSRPWAWPTPTATFTSILWNR